MGSLLLNARVRGSPFIPCYSTYECVIWAPIFVMREFGVHIFLGYSTPVLRLHSSLLCIRAPSVYGNISSTIIDSSDYSCFVCFIVGLSSRSDCDAIHAYCYSCHIAFSFILQFRLQFIHIAIVRIANHSYRVLIQWLKTSGSDKPSEYSHLVILMLKMSSKCSMN